VPYDDEGSLPDFTQFEDLAALLQRVLGGAEQVSAGRLISLVQSVHAIMGDRGAADVGMEELAHELRVRGLGNVPFQTVVGVLNAAGPVSADADVLQHVTLRDVQRIVSK
jgi:hypothetical protein